MTTSFALTYDYLCPFARNANEHVVAALRGGADLDVEFVPFSLAQVHVGEGEADVWDREHPDRESGLLALQVGLAVRDLFPDRFLDAHLALFAARHDQGRDLKDPQVLRDALAGVDIDADAVFAQVAEGGPLDTIRKAHTAAAEEHEVWGVPTFIGRDRAVFVRLLERPEGDTELATATVRRVMDLVDGWANLHEFKQSDLPK